MSKSDKKEEKSEAAHEEPVSTPDGHFFSSKRLFGLFVTIRLASIVFTQTWFVPDEYWQSQEPAHRLVFNYGYLTWEWRVGIRSYLYPLVIASWYKILDLLSLDNTILLIYVSPVCHAIFTAIADLVFYKYSTRAYGSSIGGVATACRLILWYSLYTGARSLTNNIEEAFTIFCLNSLTYDKSQKYWPLHLFAFISFAVRPTAAVGLIPIYVYQFLALCPSIQSKVKFLTHFVLVGVVILGLSVWIDSYFYGKFILTAYNFLKYNVLHKIGDHYGTHPWYWYFTQGMPVLLFAHIMLLILGLKFYSKVKFPIAAILFNMIFYSFLSHKEFRFLTQVLPFAMVICAYGVETFKQFFGNRKGYILLVLFGICNLALAIIIGVYHQQGAISVMNHLRSRKLEPGKHSVLFLMPCHSTPYFSYLHKNISMRFLRCEPNLNESRKSYIDEADAFYTNADEWFQRYQRLLEERTTHLVMFASLPGLIKAKHPDTAIDEFITRFDHCKNFSYSFVDQSSRVSKDLVLCIPRTKGKKIKKTTTTTTTGPGKPYPSHPHPPPGGRPPQPPQPPRPSPPPSKSNPSKPKKPPSSSTAKPKKKKKSEL